ncbi:hypothetical protein, partial [Streptomyces prunicolor]|uniref:hypothetical protein n=1 Tax=Streptomyces prunicolor TaxID=67348 RepID=UPI0033FCC7EF
KKLVAQFPAPLREAPEVLVGATLGQLLLAAGEREQARQVFQTSRAAAAKIGFADAIDQLDELLKATDDENEES